MEELQLVRNIATSSILLQLYKTILISEFIVSLKTPNTLFSMTLPLCKNLQSTNCELVEAAEHIKTTINELGNLRENMDHTLKSIFEKAELLLKTINELEKIQI